jgi:AcrR family transcriptional regulator
MKTAKRVKSAKSTKTMKTKPTKQTSTSRKPAPKLDTRLVIDTALRLLNEVGLDGLTLRTIAKALGVQAPALYWHFDSKQALLDEMATEMYRRMAASGKPPRPETWQKRLLTMNRQLRAALLTYRDGARVFSGSRFTGTEHGAGMEATLRFMVDAGFTLRQAIGATSTLFAFTIGFLIEEQGVQPLPNERREGYDVAERAQRMAAYPLSAAAGAEIFGRYDERFDDGLKVILAGIDARYGES